MLICDLIEAGAKPNQDSLICAALSAPVFIPYILNHLKAEGIDVKGTLTARYGEIVLTNPTTNTFDEATSQRIKLLETNQFWKTVWVSRKRQEENPNFHLPTVKAYLTEYLSSHEGISNIFVPFCGKSVDMYYLQQAGYHVVGADLSDEATGDFFVEHGLEFTKTKSGPFVIKTAKVDKGSITLICGDLLKLTTEHLKNVDLVYDRAGYNSVPLSVRLAYSNLLSERLPEKTKILMGFLDIEPKDPKLGPPYYISDDELEAFKKRFDLTVKKESRSEFFAS